KFVAIGRLTPCFMAFLILYPASQIAWQEMGPMWQGWPQRVVCAGYFFWLSLAGWRLSTLDLAPPNRRPIWPPWAEHHPVTDLADGRRSGTGR
ncbi:MAG: hypothetical protein AB7S59_25110, partial [Parvibaculaceae bacterium]